MHTSYHVHCAHWTVNSWKQTSICNILQYIYIYILTRLWIQNPLISNCLWLPEAATVKGSKGGPNLGCEGWIMRRSCKALQFRCVWQVSQTFFAKHKKSHRSCHQTDVVWKQLWNNLWPFIWKKKQAASWSIWNFCQWDVCSFCCQGPTSNHEFPESLASTAKTLFTSAHLTLQHLKHFCSKTPGRHTYGLKSCRKHIAHQRQLLCLLESCKTWNHIRFNKTPSWLLQYLLLDLSMFRVPYRFERDGTCRHSNTEHFGHECKVSGCPRSVVNTASHPMYVP